MKKEFRDELPKEVFEKTKVLTLVLFCFAIVMIFAGFISAYIVQSSGNVWVRLSPPQAFVYSTVAVVVGSVLLYLSKLFARKGITGAITMSLGLALLSGIIFCYFQVRGWGQLINGGNLVSVSIINPKGQYGQKFHFEKNDQPIGFDGQNYVLEGELLPETEVAQLRQFAHDICESDYSLGKQKIELQQDWSPYSIVSEDGRRVRFEGTSQTWEGDSTLSRSDQQDLFNFSLAVHLGMEYFKMTGEYGKDFAVILNKEELEFENRKFYYKELTLTDEEIKGIEAIDFEEYTYTYNVRDGELWHEDGSKIDISKGSWSFKTKLDSAETTVVVYNGDWTVGTEPLTPEQIKSIEASSTVKSVKEIIVANGALIRGNGEEVDISNGRWDFEYRAGKVDFPIVIQDGVWTRLRSEISDDDYAEISGKGNTASSYFWVVTVVHFVHILGGIIYLLVLFIMALNKRFTPSNHLKIRLGGIYWHVLGGLWLILFFFFQYYH